MDASEIVLLERRRRRQDELQSWQHAANEFRQKREAFAQRRQCLSPRMIESLDRQLLASIVAEHVIRAGVLIEFGARATLSTHAEHDQVNFASITQRILEEDESQESRLMILAQLALLSGSPSVVSTSTLGNRRLSAFDIILSFGVDRRPQTSLRLLQMMAATGFRIPQASLPYWTAFMDSFAVEQRSHEVCGSIVRLAVAHEWFDLDLVMGDGSWNRFPHAILGALPSQFLLSEMIAAATTKIRSWRPDQTRRLNHLLRQHGQSSATILEYFQRFGHTRRLLRSILLQFRDLRRVVLVHWPQMLVHLYESHDFTTLRLLYDLESKMVGSVAIDDRGNTLLHYMARFPNRIAARSLALFTGDALHCRNDAGENPMETARRLGHRLPFNKIDEECVSQ